MIAPSFREFVECRHLPNDRGKAVVLTPLLRRFVEAVESGARTICVASPRRVGKSTCITQFVGWKLLTTPLFFGVILAASREQAAAILSQKLTKPLRLYQRIRGTKTGLRFSDDSILNQVNGAQVVVVASSEGSVPGRTADALLIDEMAYCDRDVIETLRPSAAGGTTIMVGTPGVPRGPWYDAIHTPEPGAVVIEVQDVAEAGNPELDAAWVQKEIDRLQKSGPWGVLKAAREWKGAWNDLTESAFLNGADVLAAERDKVEPYDRERDVTVVACDLSISRDLTSIVVLARRKDEFRVLDLMAIDPAQFPGGQIDFEHVAAKLKLVHARYRPRRIVIDRFQAVLLAQQLRKAGLKIQEVQVTAQLNQLAFEGLSELLIQRKLTWVRNERLRSELLTLQVEENSTGGWKVTDSDSRLHRDLSWSLASACHAATRPGFSFRREPSYSPQPSAKAEWAIPWELWEETPEEKSTRKLDEAIASYDRTLKRYMEGSRHG